MSYEIRRATMEDAGAIARVQVASWRSTYEGIVPESFLAGMQETTLMQRWRGMWAQVAEHIFVVAEGEGRDSIFGFACGGRLRVPVEPYDGEIFAIYLLETWQRRGAGRALMARLAESLYAAGFARLLVWVLEGNPAVGFYERLGGVRVTRKVIDIGGVDLPEIALGWAEMPGAGAGD